MDCNEFKFPIIAAYLLTENTNITYNVPATIHYQKHISVNATGSYATLTANTDGTYGTAVIADAESYKITDTLSSKQGGQYQKVTLEYECSSQSCDTSQEVTSFFTQQSNLRKNAYSLLLEFFDGSYGLVRSFSHGDGFSFDSKEDNGTIKNTITIYNINGVQFIDSIPAPTPPTDADANPSA